MHLCGFALYANDPTRQMELHHYCCKLTEDVTQCAVFDSDKPNARLIGVEYVVSERVFDKLPAEEQRYWHSHAYDVKSGSFICPDVPHNVEKMVVQDLLTTYGKTWVFWQVDKGDTLPFGAPHLMMVATQDGEWNPKLFQQRDQRMTYSTESRLKNIADLRLPTPHLGADSWTNGRAPNLVEASAVEGMGGLLPSTLPSLIATPPMPGFNALPSEDKTITKDTSRATFRMGLQEDMGLSEKEGIEQQTTPQGTQEYPFAK